MSATAGQQYPPEAPEFVKLILADQRLSGGAFASLGIGLFDFLESAGADVREAVYTVVDFNIRSGGTALPGRARAMFIEFPGESGHAIASDAQATRVWTTIGMVSSLALTGAHVPVMEAMVKYYKELPGDRKQHPSAEQAALLRQPASYADKLLEQGKPVPPPVKPADDKVTGETVEKTPEQQAADFARAKREIAARYGVDAKDVIILTDDDFPEGDAPDVITI